jgi:hypothetical protein
MCIGICRHTTVLRKPVKPEWGMLDKAADVSEMCCPIQHTAPTPRATPPTAASGTVYGCCTKERRPF